MSHEEKVQQLVEKIKRLRASMPQSMWEAMQRRVCAQVSVAVATDAILALEESNAKG